MTSVVSYDVWRTLLRGNASGRARQLALLAKLLGYSGGLETLQKAKGEVSSELHHTTMMDGHHYGTEDRIARMAEVLGVSTPSTTAIQEFKGELAAVQAQFLPVLTDPELPAIFSAIRSRGIRIAVISNTNMTDGVVVHRVLAAHGLVPHYALYSDELGVAKPNPQIFAELVRRSSTEPEDIVHIGDSRRADVEGARAAGLAALLYDPNGSQTTSTNVLRHHREVFSYLKEEN